MTADASRPFLRILLGPTASGKERTALACAERLGGEILSVDSMKIYRGLDIGTAKPDAEIRAAIPHHGLDLIEPTDIFSVAQYVAAAESALGDIAARDRVPLLAGGTALYYKGLLEGIFDGPPADPDLRARLLERAAAEEPGALHAELLRLDPVAAERIHPRDTRRVVRALEVVSLTGRPISEHQRQWTRGPIPANAFRYPCALVGLAWPRPILHQRIEARVDRMMASGLLDEARTVYDRRDDFSHTPLQAVGYKEFFRYFSGDAPLDDCVELLKRNTRRLAKSQMTWFRKFPCTWITPDDDQHTDNLARQVVELWDRQRADAPTGDTS